MLCVRLRHKQDTIRIGDDITIEYQVSSAGQLVLRIAAPDHVPIIQEKGVLPARQSGSDRPS